MQVKFINEMTPLSDVIKVKDLVSPFVVVNEEMNEVNSLDLKGMKLYLTLPSVDTPVCSLELSKFIQLLKDEDITVLAISMDLPFALSRWCQSHASEKVIVASDFRYHDFSDASGLLMPAIGLFSRSVMIVNEENVVEYVEVVEDVSQEPDYDQVLAEIKRLKNSR